MFENKSKCEDKTFEKIIKLYKKNPQKGIEKMKKLCDKQNVNAALFLSGVYGQYHKNAVDPQQKAKFAEIANSYALRAADYGDVCCQYSLARMFEVGQGFPKNDQMAFKYYLLAAQNGDAKAQTNVSRYYTLGIGVAHNAKEAMFWKVQAANQGETIAMINIANSYENGKGAPKDNNQAIAWYTKALETAKYYLQIEGNGVREYCESNEKKAVDLATEGLRRMEIQVLCEEYRQMENEFLKEHTLKKIESYANEGEWRAQFELGLICENNQDYSNAIKWYQLASDNGSSGAMTNIGLIYYYGKASEQNYELAYKWIKRAVDYAANTYAMYILGEMYEKGIYVEKNMDVAISWYRKADMQGSPQASKKLKYIFEKY